MPKERAYRISLTKGERKIIRRLQKRASSENARTRYSIILNADERSHGTVPSYRVIGQAAGASVPTVIDTLKKYCTLGLEAAITPNRNRHSDTARLKVTGEVEARIIATACKAAPEGYVRWTLTLLEKECTVILEEPVSRATIGRVLKRNDLHPHLSAYWCIPPEADADFVAHMEDILDIYQQPYNPARPLWCMDEKPYQILDEARQPIPMKRGSIEKIDSEYVRNGTVSIFCFIEPHTGKIIQSVQETRTAVDWAEQIKHLVDDIAPGAEKIVLVMDNLNTHTIASLYKAFGPEEARRIARKLDIHYTPKHGSWLDIAEIAINIMTRECLDRRIPCIEALRRELDAWERDYNGDPSPINWQFTTTQSRIKLKRLYPDITSHHASRDNRRRAKSL